MSYVISHIKVQIISLKTLKLMVLKEKDLMLQSSYPKLNKRDGGFAYSKVKNQWYGTITIVIIFLVAISTFLQ